GLGFALLEDTRLDEPGKPGKRWVRVAPKGAPGSALLLAQARIEGRTEADIDECVTRLRKEKAYLFGSSNPLVMPRKTAGANDRVTRNQTVLEQAAKRAARTGSRVDLQRYLMLRRSMM
ncbi:MAG TPA: hypothetical protein PK373_03895, partial [Sedimentisphaerales bacterium]|nr:hypothetical protein [Sedimentisphaerales bacterium]